MGWRDSRLPEIEAGRPLAHGPVRDTAHARGFRSDRRWAVGCAGAAFALAMLAEADSGDLGAAYAAATLGAALVVLALLWPPRVTAGQGRLAVRGLLRTRTVRTDALAGMWLIGDLATSLVLRDVDGRRVELDSETVVANPLLWHLLEAGVHRSQERGTLRTGARVLDALAHRVDGEAAAILRASGLN
ncbi:hypothetical protein [Actinacidiphila rubida]|uniref:PH domain-containing protein n=1 Tax=Actinacidiphila rubida TaxID=310780 RepID=A0A1H8SR58_9ACTN|nr:hypothetical protein [Actinacidiphila rubida]SEO81055.1 hypothetical protein SAMN05216267_10452 [Actinacidiphila rubida]